MMRAVVAASVCVGLSQGSSEVVFLGGTGSTSASCARTVDLDCSGHDVAHVPGKNAKECCAACANNSACGAFVHIKGGWYGDTCYLKSRCVPTSGCAGSRCTAGVMPVPPAPPPAKPPAPGPYKVQHEEVTVNGYVCGKYQTAGLYYPAAEGSFPVIAFAHGYDNPGDKAYNCYFEMLSDVAAAGYIVIASAATSYPLECSNEWEDQIRSIEWVKTNLSNRIDFSKKVGLLGHSMGGGATYHSASVAVMVAAHNIGAAVALHPQITSPWSLQPITASLVPILFGTGSNDSVVSPASVKVAYAKTSGVAKAYSEIHEAGHEEPQSDCGSWESPGKRRHTPYAIAMFDCHLKGDESQCDMIYGSGADSLCSGPVKMSDCQASRTPQCNQKLEAGATCQYQYCHTSRGPTDCVDGFCYCQADYCASDNLTTCLPSGNAPVSNLLIV